MKCSHSISLSLKRADALIRFLLALLISSRLCFACSLVVQISESIFICPTDIPR